MFQKIMERRRSDILEFFRGSIGRAFGKGLQKKLMDSCSASFAPPSPKGGSQDYDPLCKVEVTTFNILRTIFFSVADFENWRPQETTPMRKFCYLFRRTELKLKPVIKVSMMFSSLCDVFFLVADGVCHKTTVV